MIFLNLEENTSCSDKTSRAAARFTPELSMIESCLENVMRSISFKGKNEKAPFLSLISSIERTTNPCLLNELTALDSLVELITPLARDPFISVAL